MKWFILITILISVNLTLGKSNDKGGPIKKASSHKPTKSPKSILEEFAGLSDDDTKFIKELDKQFKIHGDKIKIKVEKVNGTIAPTKNSKRTIDGSLGYGYHQPAAPGFFFSQPKFQIYPYSQHDIPPARVPAQNQFVPSFGPPQSRYRNSVSSPLHTSIRAGGATAVTVQPSHGYEINLPPQIYQTQGFAGHGHQQGYYNDFQNQVPQEDPVPVILLRIPGPQKYASHLQSLLQRYLEIRAAQYIAELQQQEHQAQNEQIVHHQHQVQPEPEIHHQKEQPFAAPGYLPKVTQHSPSVSYVTPVPDHTVSQGHSTSLGYSTPGYSTPEPQIISVSENSQVLPSQAVFEDHQIETGPQQPFALEYRHNVQHHEEEEPHVQAYHQQQIQSQIVSPGQQQAFHQAQQQQQQQVYQEEQQQQAIYQQEQPQYVYEEEQPAPLETSENYPSNRHTQVLFTHNYDQQQHVPQPQPQPLPIQQHHTEVVPSHHYQQRVYQQSAPAPQAPTHIIQAQQQLQHAQQQQQYEYYQQAQEEQQQQLQHIVITPKPRAPFNFHAHGNPATLQQLGRKRDAQQQFTGEQYKKYSKIVNRLKKRQPQPTRMIRKLEN